MPRWRIILALMRKEGIQIVRDPSSLITAFVFPAVLLILYSSGVSLDLKHLPIGMVLEDTSPLVYTLVDSFQNSDYLEVRIASDRKSVAHEMEAGHIKGFVVIPVDFSKQYYRTGETAQIQVIGDGSDPNTAQFMQQYTQGIVAGWVAAQAGVTTGAVTPIVLESRLAYNEQIESQWFLIPGSLAVIMTLTGSLLTALVVAREWEKGTMESLMATPISMVEILMSKVVTYLLLSLASLMLCLFIAHDLYGVPFRGSVFGLTACALPYMVYAVEMGLLISVVTRSQIAASQLALFATFLPAVMLSGFIFDIETMPQPIQWLTYVAAARYFVSNLKTLFLVGDAWSVLVPNICFTLIFCALLGWLIIRRSGKRLDI